MARSKIVYEDHGVDTETVSGLGFDVGPMMTHASARGTGFTMRLLSGVVVPVTRTHSNSGIFDYPPSRLTVAIPVGFDVGWAF